MQFTLVLEDNDLRNPTKLKQLSAALLVMAGEKPAIPAGYVTIKLGTGTTDAEAALDRLSNANRVSGEQLVREQAHAASAQDQLDPYLAGMTGASPNVDDPAAILAAARAAEGAPIVPLAQTTPDAPSGADAALSTTALAGASDSSQASTTELDKDGLPWDERCHASSHAKNKDGTWRRRSKLADGVYEAVEAELRLHYPKPVAQIPPPPPPGAAGGGGEFAALISRLHTGFARAEDPVTKDDQVAAMKHFQIAGLEELSKRPDLFEAFANMLGI